MGAKDAKFQKTHSFSVNLKQSLQEEYEVVLRSFLLTSVMISIKS